MDDLIRLERATRTRLEIEAQIEQWRQRMEREVQMERMRDAQMGWEREARMEREREARMEPEREARMAAEKRKEDDRKMAAGAARVRVQMNADRERQSAVGSLRVSLRSYHTNTRAALANMALPKVTPRAMTVDELTRKIKQLEMEKDRDRLKLRELESRQEAVLAQLREQSETHQREMQEMKELIRTCQPASIQFDINKSAAASNQQTAAPAQPARSVQEQLEKAQQSQDVVIGELAKLNRDLARQFPRGKH